MGGYCRCWAPYSSAAAKQLRLQNEEVAHAADAVEALRQRDGACRAELAAQGRRLVEAVEALAAGEAATQAAVHEADTLVQEVAVAEVHLQDIAAAKLRRDARSAALGALRAKLLGLQAEHRALRLKLATPPWRAGQEFLLSGLRIEAKSLAVRLADRRHLNRCMQEDLRAQREASTVLLELGDQQTCGLAAVRAQNDGLEAETERVVAEVASLQDTYWDAVPFQGMDAAELTRLQRSTHVWSVVMAKMEKDLECERRLAGVAAIEAEEAAAQLLAHRTEAEAAEAAAAADAIAVVEAGSPAEAMGQAPPSPPCQASSSCSQAPNAARASSSGSPLQPLLSRDVSESSQSPQSQRWSGPRRWGAEFAELLNAVSRANAQKSEGAAEEAREHAAASERAAAEAQERRAEAEAGEQAEAAELRAREQAEAREREVLAEAGMRELKQAEARNLDLRQEIQAAREQLEQQQLRQEIATMRDRMMPAGAPSPESLPAWGTPARQAALPLAPPGTTPREQQLLLRERREQEALRSELAERMALSAKACEDERLLQQERLLQEQLLQSRLRQEISARAALPLSSPGTGSREQQLLLRERQEQEALRHELAQRTALSAKAASSATSATASPMTGQPGGFGLPCADGPASAEALQRERLLQRELLREIGARTAHHAVGPEGLEAQLLKERLEQQRLRHELSARAAGLEDANSHRGAAAATPARGGASGALVMASRAGQALMEFAAGAFGVTSPGTPSGPLLA